MGPRTVAARKGALDLQLPRPRANHGSALEQCLPCVDHVARQLDKICKRPHFARLRARVAHCDYKLSERRAEEWLLVEWPASEIRPAKYWLAAS